MPPEEPIKDNPSPYFMDTSDVREQLRLSTIGQAITAAMGGTLPEQQDVAHIHRVLDIACGPGEWAIEVARTYPSMRVTGIDISHRMIEYAQAQAQAQALRNVTFRVVDAFHQPWTSRTIRHFDLINGRLLVGIIGRSAWPDFIKRCLQALRPGGILRLTDTEAQITSGEACERLNSLFNVALHTHGHSFSPHGEHIGITSALGRLVRDAGLVHIGSRAHTVDFSAGAPAHDSFLENSRFGYPLSLPFLLKYGLTSQEEFERLYLQAMTEWQTEDFLGIQYFLTVWGAKPGT